MGNAMKDLDLPMGYGQRFSKKSGEYPTTTYRQIEPISGNPKCKLKDFALCFIPFASLVSFASAHLVQKELGECWILASNIDEGSPEMDFVIGGVEAALGDLHMLVFFVI